MRELREGGSFLASIAFLPSTNFSLPSPHPLTTAPPLPLPHRLWPGTRLQTRTERERERESGRARRRARARGTAIALKGRKRSGQKGIGLKGRKRTGQMEQREQKGGEGRRPARMRTETHRHRHRYRLEATQSSWLTCKEQMPTLVSLQPLYRCL